MRNNMMSSSSSSWPLRHGAWRVSSAKYAAKYGESAAHHAASRWHHALPQANHLMVTSISNITLNNGIIIHCVVVAAEPVMIEQRN